MDTCELITVLFHRMNERNLDALGELLADEVEFHFPKTDLLAGKKRVTTFFKVLYRKFPTLQFSLGRILCSDNMAAAEWTNLGNDKSGAPYQNAGVTIIEVQAGKIVYLSDTFKDTEKF